MVDNHNDHNTGVRDGGVHGHSSIQDAPVRDKGFNWLPWLLGALALLGLLWFLTRDREPDTVVEPTATETVGATDTVRSTDTVGATDTVTTPDVAVAPVAYRDTDFGTYLAGTEPLGRAYTLDNITFASGSANLATATGGDIGSLAATMKKYPTAAIALTGFADPSGDAAANAKLSADRANAVKDALVKAGVAANRIATAAAGETGATTARANRKVEMRVTAR